MSQLPPNVRAVIARHQETWPVKVGLIARDLGVEVLASALPTQVSGSLTRSKDDPTTWVIKVNRHEHKNRQRFTVAHEIAHYLLHRDRIGDGISDDTLYRSAKLTDAVEWEANRLAAELLMPWELIRKATDRGINTPEALAEAFEVSEAAMKVRLGLPT